MKKLIATTTIIAATLFITNNTNADGFNRNPEARPQAHGTLKQAVDQMVASIERSLGVFEGLNRSQKEKMAEFENILAQIKYSVAVTSKEGALSRKIARAVSLANRQSEWCENAANTKTKPGLAERYRKLATAASDKATRISKNADLVLKTNAELTELLPDITDEKEYFLAAAIIGDLETANQSLEEVQRSMKKVVNLLKQLRHMDEEFNVPAPAFVKK